jgi:SnoaL-like domain
MTSMSTPALDAALEQLIDTYCGAWNEVDPSRRLNMLSSVWAPGATYTDPTVHAVGAEELLAHIATVIARRPGAKVVRTSVVDAHHRLARFAWRIVRADGSMLPEGVDFAEISAEGKIQRIMGFFGALAPL